jgi:hypothetical protein
MEIIDLGVGGLWERFFAVMDRPVTHPAMFIEPVELGQPLVRFPTEMETQLQDFEDLPGFVDLTVDAGGRFDKSCSPATAASATSAVQLPPISTISPRSASVETIPWPTCGPPAPAVTAVGARLGPLPRGG